MPPGTVWIERSLEMNDVFRSMRRDGRSRKTLGHRPANRSHPPRNPGVSVTAEMLRLWVVLVALTIRRRLEGEPHMRPVCVLPER